MATATTLTYEQFRAQYEHGDRAYEFWYGEAIPKGMPTVIHGFLQKIIMFLLEQYGLIAASEVELRIVPGAYPKPDVIARKTKPSPLESYPTAAWDIAVEILSEDDKLQRLKEKCRKYQAWGFGAIYIVDPSDRTVVEWRDGIMTPCSQLASIPAERIWNALDEQYSD